MDGYRCGEAGEMLLQCRCLPRSTKGYRGPTKSLPRTRHGPTGFHVGPQLRLVAVEGINKTPDQSSQTWTLSLHVPGSAVWFRYLGKVVGYSIEHMCRSRPQVAPVTFMLGRQTRQATGCLPCRKVPSACQVRSMCLQMSYPRPQSSLTCLGRYLDT